MKYHDASTLGVNVLLQGLDVNFHLFLKAQVLLLPHFPLLKQLLVEIYSCPAVALANILGHAASNNQILNI